MADFLALHPRRGGREPLDEFVVVFVCTSNTALSPLAEQLLRRALQLGDDSGRALPVRLLSRGTRALVDESMKGWAADRSTAAGADPSHHSAQQLRATDLAGADLVVALAESHRRAVAKMLPAVAKRLVTLKELAGLTRLPAPATEAPSSSLGRSAAQLLGRRLSLATVRSERTYSITEPAWASPADHARCGREISTATTAVAAWIGAALPAQRA